MATKKEHVITNPEFVDWLREVLRTIGRDDALVTLPHRHISWDPNTKEFQAILNDTERFLFERYGGSIRSVVDDFIYNARSFYIDKSFPWKDPPGGMPGPETAKTNTELAAPVDKGTMVFTPTESYKLELRADGTAWYQDKRLECDRDLVDAMRNMVQGVASDRETALARERDLAKLYAEDTVSALMSERKERARLDVRLAEASRTINRLWGELARAAGKNLRDLEQNPPVRPLPKRVEATRNPATLALGPRHQR